MKYLWSVINAGDSGLSIFIATYISVTCKNVNSCKTVNSRELIVVM